MASPVHTQSPSPPAGFPILALAIIGILATALLLISYYVFAIKCCLNSRNVNIFNPFFISRSRRRLEPFVIYAPAEDNNRGLGESEIRSIPILQFKKTELDIEQRNMFECAVCLNEFQEEEKLRILPMCSHVFHIDCIDIWLQTNANCPLCRSSISISTTTTTLPPTNQTISPITPSQDQPPFTDTVLRNDQDFLVIEVRNGDHIEQLSPSPRKVDQKSVYKKGRKFHHVSSMGDECINVRAKDDQFSVQPIRRSISMDSSGDRQLFLAIQETIQQNKQNVSEGSSSEACTISNGPSKFRRSLFSFGNSRGSRTAVLPIQFQQQN